MRGEEYRGALNGETRRLINVVILVNNVTASVFHGHSISPNSLIRLSVPSVFQSNTKLMIIDHLSGTVITVLQQMFAAVCRFRCSRCGLRRRGSL